MHFKNNKWWKNKKPKYNINIKNEEIEYFPEDNTLMILGYLKQYTETSIERKLIKKIIIIFIVNIDNNQILMTIEAA